ncbi:hypothetical protein [Vibrio ouci]|uniref:Uncharacterized protein n=1 Tax=Vibrio ouci TaxID=2499078 RepID=A0A4Y8WFT2_9VIBR|nr:hypothetical protein [Vibrio ouci]TFH91455.1 hypothetical protein ELS82_11310 [Vibrio ouci]
MKRTLLALTLGALASYTITTNAKPPKPALVDITPGECSSEFSDPSFNVEADWTWAEIEETSEHTKFGGDAEVLVMYSASYAFEETIIDLVGVEHALSFSVSQYNEEADQTNEVTYTCVDYECNAELMVDDFSPMILAMLSDSYPDVVWDSFSIDGAELDNLHIKGMDPSMGSKKMKHQNYPLVNLCPADE